MAPFSSEVQVPVDPPVRWGAKLAVALTVGATALLIDWAVSDQVSVLTAVVAAATIAYCWFTYDLVRAAATDRADRQAAADAADRRLVERMIIELRGNLYRRGSMHVWHAHMPFEMSAYNDARQLFVNMPDHVWEVVVDAGSKSARYNAVAEYHNHQVAAGSGAGDGEVRRIAAEAHDSQEVAVGLVEQWLAAQ